MVRLGWNLRLQVRTGYCFGASDYVANPNGPLHPGRASVLNLGAVVRETEPKPMPAQDFDRETNSCRIAAVCRLGGVLDEPVQASYAVPDKYSLEDILNNRQSLARILFAPPTKRASGVTLRHRTVR